MIRAASGATPQIQTRDGNIAPRHYVRNLNHITLLCISHPWFTLGSNLYHHQARTKMHQLMLDALMRTMYLVRTTRVVKPPPRVEGLASTGAPPHLITIA